MISVEEIRKLASLARIKLTKDEEEKLSKDMGNILAYIEQIQEVSATVEESEKPLLRNVMRDDAEPHQAGIHTEALLAEAPKREENYVKVKKIL
ncbi:Asp-tRNA(Asn)/Glu-tRNA(Gln) amidotransferase subunit GatC [Candidatus Parcubacteria bacterium]|nr:Asp-tRNA(Asn)/Glu-tRNA(Gln) amidotransferase subunit GatC [Candidatus Parcubacteria bacterium]